MENRSDIVRIIGLKFKMSLYIEDRRLANTPIEEKKKWNEDDLVVVTCL